MKCAYNRDMAKKRVQSKPPIDPPANLPPAVLVPVEPARPRSPINGQPVPPPRWKPGQSGNPGGVPKGKRISTWLAEYGDMPVENWPVPGTPAFNRLPGNARIALAQLRRALEQEDGLPAAAWAADRVEGGVDRTVHLTHKQEAPLSLEAAREAMKALDQAKPDDF